MTILPIIAGQHLPAGSTVWVDLTTGKATLAAPEGSTQGIVQGPSPEAGGGHIFIEPSAEPATAVERAALRWGQAGLFEGGR